MLVLAISPGAAFQQRYSATHLAESILAEVDYVGSVGLVVWLLASSRCGYSVNRALARLSEVRRTEFRDRTAADDLGSLRHESRADIMAGEIPPYRLAAVCDELVKVEHGMSKDRKGRISESLLPIACARETTLFS